MDRPRRIVLSTLLALLAAAGGWNDPPGRPGPQGMPPPGARHGDAATRIDPDTDEVLAAIREAVAPGEKQWQAIVARYAELREKQRQVLRKARRALRRGEERGREGWRDVRDAVAAEIAALNERFLASCRGLMNAEQLEAWDDCAAALDLSPRRGSPWAERARGPDVGTVAPDFELTDLDGETVRLKALRGKPVVLEFGSYTCPVFRRKVEAMRALQRDFGDAVTWLLVYTREAHPAGGRAAPANARDGIELPQHATFEQRVEAAKRCREKLGLAARVLVDGLDNAVTEAYSGHPNRAYVIDPGGRIASKQVWFDPARTRQVLATLSGRPERRDSGT